MGLHIRKPQMDALANLRACGCLEAFERYSYLSVEGKMREWDIRRLTLMYLEQCWSQGEIAGVTLTSNDISEPFPKIVRQCLSNKIKNAKSLKNETFEHIGEARRLFVEKTYRMSS